MAQESAVNASDIWQRTALQVLEIESAAVAAMRHALDASFMRAVEVIAACRGKVVCSGVGKSGHILGKIAATFSSTGTPAFFMHAGEAGHGDLGMIGDDDILLLFSYSGESEELMGIVPAVKRMGIPLIAITGTAGSNLAKAADICLLAAVEREACPHNLAPTASTTAALALGDALAMTVLTARGFSPDDFARTHPAGNLGKRLLLRVSDVMRRGADIPLVREDATFSEVLMSMTSKRMGMTLVQDRAGGLCGIVTDGDLRRALDKIGNLHDKPLRVLMTATPVAVPPDMLAAQALQMMKEKSLNHLAVTEEEGRGGSRLVGALSFHDLLQHKIL